MDLTKLIYHYTSFEKLQCILRYGTLRFKESTSSNDILDTIGFEQILKSMPAFKAPGIASELLNFLLGYYQRDAYCPSAKFLVACFSMIPDSRLLWDAYTMHRPGNQKCPHGEDKYCFEAITKYDGVCIAFRQERLEEVLHGTEGIKCDKTNIMPILYGDAKIKSVLNEWMKEALHKSIELSKDPGQSQDIIPPIPITRNKAAVVKKSLVVPTMEFLQKVEAYSPFFKHQFWHEEKEVRASMMITNSHLSKYNIVTTHNSCQNVHIIKNRPGKPGLPGFMPRYTGTAKRTTHVNATRKNAAFLGSTLHFGPMA